MRSYPGRSVTSTQGRRRSDDEKINNTKNPRSNGSKIQWRKDGDERDRLAKMAEGWGRYGARSGLEATHPSKRTYVDTSIIIYFIFYLFEVL